MSTKDITFEGKKYIPVTPLHNSTWWMVCQQCDLYDDKEIDCCRYRATDCKLQDTMCYKELKEEGV